MVKAEPGALCDATLRLTDGADLAGEPCRLDYCEATVFAANSLTTGKRITFLRFFIQNGHAWAVKNGSLLFRRV